MYCLFEGKMLIDSNLIALRSIWRPETMYDYPFTDVAPSEHAFRGDKSTETPDHQRFLHQQAHPKVL